MNYLFLNCETVPSVPQRDPDYYRDQVPKSYTGKKAEEWLVEKARKDWSDQAKDISRARIVVVTLLGRDGHVDMLASMDEEQLMKASAARIEEVMAMSTGVLAAFCGTRFDFPLLLSRFAKYGLRAARHMRCNRYGDDRHVDPLVILGGEGKLDHWARTMDIEFDNPIDGARIPELISRGDPHSLDLVKRHTESRVLILAELVRKLAAVGLAPPMDRP